MHGSSDVFSRLSERLNISFSKWQVWQASSEFPKAPFSLGFMFTLGAWVVAESGVVLMPRVMHLGRVVQSWVKITQG